MTLAIKLVNDHTVDVTLKSKGQVINRNHTVISEDGKTMTSTENGVDEKGGRVHKGRDL